MTITFVSNYINHHQIPTANALYQQLEGNYYFIQTEPMEQDRVAMGWDTKTGNCPYLLKYYEEPQKCQDLIEHSDIVMFGGVEDERYIQDRIRSGKIVLRYCERLYKEGVWRAVSPRGLIKKYHDHTKHKKAPVFLLCAGGYVAYDFSIIRAYPNKKLKWGYFPETKYYDKVELFHKKEQKLIQEGGTTQILWAARFITCKHPETVVELALRLKKDNQKFHITMIGGGELEVQIQQAIKEAQLEDVITLKGFLKPDEVREEMERASVFLFTSDFIEGWGAVLNEAMNSGCAVISSHAAGGASFLIEDGKNGFIYRYGDAEELAMLTKKLLQNKELQKSMGERAYETIVTQWNAEHGAKVLIKLCENLIMENMTFEEQGPLSEAPVVTERSMYRYVTRKRGEHGTN